MAMKGVDITFLSSLIAYLMPFERGKEGSVYALQGNSSEEEASEKNSRSSRCTSSARKGFIWILKDEASGKLEWEVQATIVPMWNFGANYELSIFKLRLSS